MLRGSHQTQEELPGRFLQLGKFGMVLINVDKKYIEWKIRIGICYNFTGGNSSSTTFPPTAYFRWTLPGLIFFLLEKFSTGV